MMTKAVALWAAAWAVCACGQATQAGQLPSAGAGTEPGAGSGAAAGGRAAEPTAPGGPLPGLTADERQRFDSGQQDFVQVETPETGLGPVFNESSCVACHQGPAVGGTNGRLVTRFGKQTAAGFDPMLAQSGTLLQDHAIGQVAGFEFKPDAVPADANVVAHRRTPLLFGLGLIEGVPDETLRALARAQPPAVRGTVSVVLDVVSGKEAVGKFGWKAQVPNLLQFAGDAYLNEMGITNPLFPSENCPQGDCSQLAHNPRPAMNDEGDGPASLADFMTFLAPLAPAPQGPAERRGNEVASAIGCLQCHVQTLTTGPSGSAALASRDFHPFSDLLLHDMGALGDGIEQGAANGRQLRTAPLWGLRAQQTLLHDGRARSVDEAIRAHDGQGAGARQRFLQLDAPSRGALLAFLGSL